MVQLVKNPINADYPNLAEEIESKYKAPKFKVGDRVMIIKYKNIFSKLYTKNLLKEIFVIDSVLKTNPWMYKLKDLNRETIIGSFYEKKCCWVRYKWDFIQNQTATLEIKSK